MRASAFRTGVLLPGLCAVVSACGNAGAPVEVRNAWSPVAPPGAGVVAVYAQIVAHDTDMLVSASTPVAERAEMHATLEENGMMRMRAIDRLELPAGKSVRFEPGGRHLMLTGLQRDMPAGTNFPLTLRFSRAGDIEVNVRVVPVQDAPADR